MHVRKRKVGKNSSGSEVDTPDYPQREKTANPSQSDRALLGTFCFTSSKPLYHDGRISGHV